MTARPSPAREASIRQAVKDGWRAAPFDRDLDELLDQAELAQEELIAEIDALRAKLAAAGRS